MTNKLEEIRNAVQYYTPKETPAGKAQRLGVPLIPEIKPYPKNNDTVAVCGKCGLEIKHIMCYSCPNADCPTGMGPFTC